MDCMIGKEYLVESAQAVSAMHTLQLRYLKENDHLPGFTNDGTSGYEPVYTELARVLTAAGMTLPPIGKPWRRTSNPDVMGTFEDETSEHGVFIMR